MIKLEHGKCFRSDSLGQKNWYLLRSDGLIKAYFKTLDGERCGMTLYSQDAQGAIKCYMVGMFGGQKVYLD